MRFLRPSFIFLVSLWGIFMTQAEPLGPKANHGLHFPALATRWDEAIPLGNGMLGALVWQEGDVLRFSLDRADLWDKRPVATFSQPEFSFDYVYENVLKGDIKPVQAIVDAPYDREPAPTKIPAGRLEISQAAFGQVTSVRLDLAEALCRVEWDSGVVMESFIHATLPVGWIRIQGVTEALSACLVPPPFGGGDQNQEGVNSLDGHDLRALGYPDPVLYEQAESTQYTQQGWGDFSFVIDAEWRREGDSTWLCVWSIQSSDAVSTPADEARQTIKRSLQRSFADDLAAHQTWWSQFWAQSSIAIPDPVLEKQWYLEQYKFGSASRRGAPPITLQAVWTADNRKIPPWKGDFHNDLNTQLSYWPCYSGNRLEDGLAFLDWLWEIKPASERWTQKFYDLPGLNVHGVTTIEGEPMGGWNQYSCSPTTSAWLAHHFYLHWRFSMDREFLRERAYPYLQAVALFLQGHSIVGADGKRQLPLSSSPEINDNRVDAWFRQTTNYDLALIRWLLGATAELATELGMQKEAQAWQAALSEWPDLALAEDDGRLLVAPNYPLKESHRHFSHLMAIHPLGLLDVAYGDADRRTIKASLDELDRLGPDWWCGYSYAWQGNMLARAGFGERAAEALRIFAECFCLPNSFHANGDQSKSGKSKMTYRPFTLEGNFAFAAGVQELLLQSHAGVVRVFPAIPAAWRDAAFSTLRAQGAFLLSAERKERKVASVRIVSEQGGLLRLANPFPDQDYSVLGIAISEIHVNSGILEISMKPGQEIVISHL
ncbi:MAG: glycoside hydrolase N-terminal domain-containing protein [bacterium]|nr:glycoside hydrolase N-terminal domain-containing protein [bacterium]